MKRYRLKKDLKQVNAGAHFYANEQGDLVCPWGTPTTLGKDIFDIFPGLLEDWFEEIPERPKTVWDLEEEEKCWLISTEDNTVYKIEWAPMYKPERKYGDIVLTEEEGQKELAWREARAILKRDTKGFKPDWSENGDKGWDIFYSVEWGKLITEIGGSCDGTLRFATEEDAEASTKTHEREWKMYLGVED